VNSVLLEFALHVTPTLRSSIEVNANLIWERLVDYSGRWVCYRFGHIVGFYKGCVSDFVAASVLALLIIS
jgi:hypothetical protein